MDHPIYAQFEADGEEAVRNNLAARRYNDQHARLAEEWVRARDQGKRDRRAAEEADIARIASAAAVEAARAASIAADEAVKQSALAEDANRIARRANRIAAAALIIAIMAAIGTITVAVIALPHLSALSASSSSYRP